MDYWLGLIFALIAIGSNFLGLQISFGLHWQRLRMFRLLLAKVAMASKYHKLWLLLVKAAWGLDCYRFILA